jgi:hypothetical protein
LINPGWINIRPSHSAKPHRQATPPSHTAKPHRQATPPSRSAKPLRQAAPPSRSAKPLRQVAPPSYTASSLRQASPPNETAKRGAGQSAPSTAWDHRPPVGSVPSHRSSWINPEWISIRPSHAAKSRRQVTPPSHAAKSRRQVTPPSHAAKSRRQGTPPSHTAKSHRQVTPPSHTAKSLREFTPTTGTAKRGAGQRAPSAAWDHSPMVGSVPSHRSTLINPGWINIRPSHSGQATPAKPLRPSHSGQATPPSYSAKPLRQATPPTDTAKRGAGQRAPSAACDHSPLGGSVPSHRRTLINSGRIGIQPSHSAN